MIFHGLFMLLNEMKPTCFTVVQTGVSRLLELNFLIIFLISETIYVNVKPEIL